MQKIICQSCGSKAHNIDRETFTIEGVNYIWETPYCSECKQILYSDKIQLKNIERKRKALRKARGLCSYEDLIKLPKRYGISRELLTEVLDIDNHEEGTIWTSIWDGEIPTREESDKIKAAWNPEEFMKFINAAKGIIPKGKYEKLVARTEGMIGKANKR